ncbi:hypothetical protein EXIGLDRAFT_718227 [Exidia glandulosa HHB12029]|uniref:Uncharacterized protein n=1 Tax=Exidia glandulosa HHB12029 TaxID=1314781 RepID=A0A165HWF4_EXIGL|nr:hypothetical protein EXIGLDRAFT_718227 [Exidia glandulosa HHB12029]
MSIADAVPHNLHLNNLRLVDNGGFDGPSLRRLLSGTGTSLEYLTLSFPANLTAPALELQGTITGIAPRLKGLHVEVRYDEFQPGARAFVEHLATILPMCRSLRVAHLLLGEEDMENVIRYLPNSVEKVIVAVESGAWDEEDIFDVEAIAKTADAVISQDLSSLRQLMVTSRASPSRQGAGAAVDLTPYEEAIAMAAAKGVELTFHGLFPERVRLD